MEVGDSEVRLTFQEFKNLAWKSAYFENLVTSHDLFRVTTLRDVYLAYSKYPLENLDSLLQRLTNYSNYARTALWELYVYSLLIDKTKVTIEKPNSNGKTIDFSIDQNRIVNIEATTIGKNMNDLKNDIELARFFNYLEKNLNFPNYHLYIEICVRDQTTPNFEGLRETIIKSLRRIPKDFPSEGFAELAEIREKDSSWHFRISWKRNHITKKESALTPIFSSTVSAQTNVRDRLEQAIDQKLEKFDSDNSSKNYLAIGNDLDFLEVTNFEILKFLFGEIQVQLNLETNQSNTICSADGFYYLHSLRLGRLAGILFQLNGFMGFGSTNRPCLWVNPHAIHPWTEGDLPFEHDTFLEVEGEIRFLDSNGRFVKSGLF